MKYKLSYLVSILYVIKEGIKELWRKHIIDINPNDDLETKR